MEYDASPRAESAVVESLFSLGNTLVLGGVGRLGICFGVAHGSGGILDGDDGSRCESSAKLKPEASI